MQNFTYIQRALDRHYISIGQELTDKVKKKVNTLLILLRAPYDNVRNPPQPPTTQDFQYTVLDLNIPTGLAAPQVDHEFAPTSHDENGGISNLIHDQLVENERNPEAIKE
ncbi:hypothetical protein SUGI_1053590 [Cryptomeria japonica]|nr:hypothetical protein SUGI_1053590 [Cryptomeria japonica]